MTHGPYRPLQLLSGWSLWCCEFTVICVSWPLFSAIYNLQNILGTSGARQLGGAKVVSIKVRERESKQRPESNTAEAASTEPSASLDSPVKAITLPYTCTTCSVTRCGVSKPADAFCTVHLRGNNDIKAIGEPIYFSRQGRLHCHPLFSAQLTAESPGPVSISGRCQSCRQETVMT